jgi:methionine biosynthesis protein MetW
LSLKSDEYYDVYWSDQGFVRANEVPNSHLSSLIRSNLGPGSLVLDVGCGDGTSIAPLVREHALDYIGVDVSATAVAFARRNNLDAREIADASDLPFNSASFDAAICLEVFEHLADPREVAAEIARVLRRAGVLIASVPNVVFWRRRLDTLGGRWNPEGDDLAISEPWRDPHLRFFTVSAFRRMLLVAGFESVEITGAHGNFLGYLPYVGWRWLWRSRPTRGKLETGSTLYRALQRRSPSLLARRLYAVARVA